MAERQETRHSIPSFGYSFYVDNESGYAFTANLMFEPQWWNFAPSFTIEVFDPNGKSIYKEFLDSVDFKNKDVFHGHVYGPPDASPPEPLKYPDSETIWPLGFDGISNLQIDVPASDSGGGVYQIRIGSFYHTLSSDGRFSSVELLLDPPLPYGWKGDMGITDLSLWNDRAPKSGTVYFCSLPPGIMGLDPNIGIKQWFQARSMQIGRKGFDIKIFKDEVDGDGELITEFSMLPAEDADGNRQKTWEVHDIDEDVSRSILTLDHSIAGPDHLRNDKVREVYRIEWENRDPEVGVNTHGDTLMIETHDATERTDPFPSNFKDFFNYSRQGITDVPLIMCSDRNTAIRLNNGISYMYDDGLEVESWDTNKIVFLNPIQRRAWMMLKKAREEYKTNTVAFNKVNTEDDPYWIGTPRDVVSGNVGQFWDYGASMSDEIYNNIKDDYDQNESDFEQSKYWNENKLNQITNTLFGKGTYEYLPCHLYEQNMNPSSPWFGVIWNWHSNVDEDIRPVIGDHLDADGNLRSLGNPYSSIFRYLYDPDGNIYSNWKDQVYPRLGPTSTMGAHIARYYSFGGDPLGTEQYLQGDGYQPTFGLGFLRDANPFYKHVGIRNRLVLSLLQQLMAFDQNYNSTFWDGDYRGGAIAFVTNTIMPLLDVYPEIGTHEDDIFQGDDAEEVKDIIRTGIRNHLERFVGNHTCSAHNQWVHCWLPMAKAMAYLNDPAIDYLFLLNVRKSDNRYNHNVPTWQESGGYDNIYCAFAVYCLHEVRQYLLKRRANVLEENMKAGGIQNSTDPVLANVELGLRDFESQLNDMTDYWNYTMALEPDGSLTGACDMNSRVDGGHLATVPRRWLQFIGNEYGSTLQIPEMSACQTLVAHGMGRQYESPDPMIRQWHHGEGNADPYGVIYDIDTNIGDQVSVEEQRAWAKGRLTEPNPEYKSKTRFREPFAKNSGGFTGLPTGGINPKVSRDAPRTATSSWMDKDDNTVNTDSYRFAKGTIANEDLSNVRPEPLPAHSDKSFVKVWPSFTRYWNAASDALRAYTNQKCEYPNSSTRPDIGGISIKTGSYYCHLHADGWNPANQDQEYLKRKNGDGKDSEYLWGMTVFGGGISLLTTPENGAVLVGKRKGFLASNQIFLKRYTKSDPAEDADLGQLAPIWNNLVEEDGSGYAWAYPSPNNATAEWDTGRGQDGDIGTFTHRQAFNYNFLNKPSVFEDGHFSDSFEAMAQSGGIGYIVREYVFNEDNIVCNVQIMPMQTVNWDEVYMTLPISIMGRGYASGDGQYVQTDAARVARGRKNISGDKFETLKNGCWKREVFVNDSKVTVGHRFFDPSGTEFEITTPGVVDKIERMVSGPGTDPAYPQTGDAPIQDGNFFWPPSQETLDKHLQMKCTHELNSSNLAFKIETVDDLLEYCNEGRDQTDNFIQWSVPAPSGYHTKTRPGKTLDDSLRVQFSSQVRNWTGGVPINFSFTITPGKSMDAAEAGM